MAEAVLAALRSAAQAEKAQASFYRALAALAEADSPELAERVNGLVADEQHHLSRLVARLLELGAPAAIAPSTVAPVGLRDWEPAARLRERAEIDRYVSLLNLDLDTRTRALIEEFLEVERRHEQQLGGKWMGA